MPQWGRVSPKKNIAHPTDARLYEKARGQFVAPAIEAGITLRHNDNRLVPQLAMHAGRHAHARQFKRMRKALTKLKGYTGHVLVRGGTRTGGACPSPSAASWLRSPRARCRAGSGHAGAGRPLRRHSAIAPEIGRMKTDDRLSRRPPKRTNGDAIFAVPCGCGQNIHEILAHIMGLWPFSCPRSLQSSKP